MTEIEEYLEAINRLRGLRSSIIALQKRLRETADALGDAGNAYVSNVGVTYPPHLLQTGRVIPGAAEFPSMEEIGTMLSNYQFAKENLQKTYDAVPGPHRAGVKAPDEV